MSNLAALRDTVASLVVQGRVAVGSEALIVAAESLAAAVDAEPDNASLWREYRQCLGQLMNSEPMDDDDVVEKLRDAMRSPVGD